MTNQLFYGDCLDVLRDLADGTKRPEYPDFSGGQTFKKAKKESGKADEQSEMF